MQKEVTRSWALFIGIGTMAAGYIYPNTSEEITKVVEDFEEK